MSLDLFRVDLGDPLVRRCLLGVRATDLWTGTPVTGGLRVSLRPNAEGASPALERRGVRGSSGVWSFHDLPGLHEQERSEDPPAPGDPGQPRFVVDIEDPSGRFLPMTRLLALPREEPLLAARMVPAPGNTVPDGWAVVRGRVARWTPSADPERPEDAPASWARLRVLVDGTPAADGLADRRGEFALAFPFPGALDPGSGGAAAEAAPEARTWPVALRVHHDEGAHAVPPARPDRGGSGGAPPPPVPDLDSLLAQPVVPVLTEWPAPGAPDDTPSAPWAQALEATLGFGRPLSIATAETPARSKAVWVHAPASHP